MESRHAMAPAVPYALGCMRGPLPDVVKGRVAVGAASRPAFLDVPCVLVHRLPPRARTPLISPAALGASRSCTARVART